MERFSIINKLIKSFNYKTYLEIGVQNGICFQRVQCENKTGVDPSPLYKEERVIEKTSDQFFVDNKENFDIIFIDGLHTYEQVKKDFENARKVLNPGGRIVFHDMNPSSEERAKSFAEGGQWNGDCYKMAIDLYNDDWNYYTVDTDNGCLVWENSKSIKDPKLNLTKDYNCLNKNRKEILNLISVEQFNI